LREQIIEIADGFWNIRGSFKLGGLIELGTQASLVRLEDGRFVLLDSYTLPDDVLGRVRELTDGGRDVDAIINVHPFHTLHVAPAHRQFPGARLFGSERHVRKASALKWQALRVDDPRMAEEFPGLEFSVPRGVDFISDDPSVHFSSVLVYHPASRTLHVDDTLNYTTLPLVGGVGFHPTLSKALERRAGAAEDFAAWAGEIGERWKDTENVCAAHSRALTGVTDFQGRVQAALGKVQRPLRAHERAHG
jgi:hypothetical protein